MNMHFSSIWIEAGKPRQKKILLCYVYREWKYLFQQDKTSKTIDCQLDRWISLIGQWENALRSGKEICVQGDMNLNFFNMDETEFNSDLTFKKLQPLVMVLFDKINPYGFS